MMGASPEVEEARFFHSYGEVPKSGEGQFITHFKDISGLIAKARSSEGIQLIYPGSYAEASGTYTFSIEYKEQRPTISNT